MCALAVFALPRLRRVERLNNHTRFARCEWQRHFLMVRIDYLVFRPEVVGGQLTRMTRCRGLEASEKILGAKATAHRISLNRLPYIGAKAGRGYPSACARGRTFVTEKAYCDRKYGIRLIRLFTQQRGFSERRTKRAVLAIPPVAGVLSFSAPGGKLEALFQKVLSVSDPPPYPFVVPLGRTARNGETDTQGKKRVRDPVRQSCCGGEQRQLLEEEPFATHSAGAAPAGRARGGAPPAGHRHVSDNGPQ